MALPSGRLRGQSKRALTVSSAADEPTALAATIAYIASPMRSGSESRLERRNGPETMHKQKHKKKHHRGGDFAGYLEPEARIEVEQRPADAELALAFLGGTGTVTGSRYLLDDGAYRLQIDAGLFQGGRELRKLNWAPNPRVLDGVDTILLTHAHLDHSGALPRLVRNGWKGRIFATRPTTELCELLLPDSGHLQQKDAEFANRHGFSRHQPALPLYTQDDAYACLEHFRSVEFGHDVELSDGVSARFRRAGHILGAASIQINWRGRTVLFSGDLGRFGDAVMRDPEPGMRTDYLVVESTYGDRRHEAIAPDQALGENIERCIARGGTVVIPAFAVGRAQSLLYHLSKVKAAGRLAGIPVFLDSPMAINASGILCANDGEHRLTSEQCKAACGVAHYVRDVEESKALTADPRPKVIISASGMATGGRVLHHLRQFAPDPKNLILFSGFQAAGTRGAAMVAGASTIKVHGEIVPVEAEVANLSMLSAHADSDEIMRWLATFPEPPKETFITHGEPGASQAMAERVREELGWSCTVPSLGGWGALA